jgi:hypothetical protein
MTLQEELKKVRNEIAILSLKADDIEKQILADIGPLKEKFLAWRNSSQGDHLTSVPDRNKFPLLREYIDDNDGMNRHQTYYVCSHFRDELYWAFEATQEEIDEAEIDPSEIERTIKLAEEILNGNLKSFKLDW